MKIFDHFVRREKTDELVILYGDGDMTMGKGTIVYSLSDVENGILLWKDVENDFAEFNDDSRRQVRNAFDLLRKPMKELGLKGVMKE